MLAYSRKPFRFVIMESSRHCWCPRRRSRRRGPNRTNPHSIARKRPDIYAKRLLLSELGTLMASRPDVTALLSEWGRGNSNALNELLPLVYAELRRVAARQLRG